MQPLLLEHPRTGYDAEDPTPPEAARTAADSGSRWIVVGIFALAGALAAQYTAHLPLIAAGACAGIMAGALAGPRLTRIGYAAAVLLLLLTAVDDYSLASLPVIQSAEARALTLALPKGAALTRVCRYLDRQHATRIAYRPAFGPRNPARSTVLVADIDTSFLLRRFRTRAKFVFDDHRHLSSSCVVGIR